MYLENFRDRISSPRQEQKRAPPTNTFGLQAPKTSTRSWRGTFGRVLGATFFQEHRVTDSEYKPKYLVIPGWVLSSGVFANLSGVAVKLLAVFGGYAHRKSGSKCWVSREVLRRVSGLSARGLVDANSELVRYGVISFSNRPGRKCKNRTTWVAPDKPFRFALPTKGQEFAEYNRMIQRFKDLKRGVVGSAKTAQPIIGKSAKTRMVKVQSLHLSPGKIGFKAPQISAQIGVRGAPEAGIEAGIETSSLGTATHKGSCARPGGNDMKDTTTATGREGSSMLDSFEPAPLKLNKDIRGLEDIPEPKVKPPRPPRKAKKLRPRGLEGITAKEPAGSTKPPRKKKAKAKKPAAKTKRVSKKLADYGTPQHDLLDRHCKNFLKRFNRDFMPNFSRDLKTAKDLLRVHKIANLFKYNDDFFTIRNDKFIEDDGFTFAMFRMRINKLVVRTKGTTQAKAPVSGTIPVGARRNITDRGYEDYWEEWSGSRWVPYSKKKDRSAS